MNACIDNIPLRFLFLSLDVSAESSRILQALIDAYPGQVECTDDPQSPLVASGNHSLILLYIGSSDDRWKLLKFRFESMNGHPPIIAFGNSRTLSRLDSDLECHIDDVIQLPATCDEILHCFSSVLNRRSNAAAKALKQEMFLKWQMDMLVGQSDHFVSAVKQIRLATESCANVLISGETGTGKELFARAIHYLGSQSAQPFVPVNCGAIPESLFENEFFGHTKGAYTGASDFKEGLIHEAEGGTLFLDEINTLTEFTQVKLLRFLEDRTYRALGSTKYVHSNVRVISAANCDLQNAVKKNSFRQDLYYRINALAIHIPPLRDRRADIPILTQHYLEKFSRTYHRENFCISEAAMKKLMSYEWPGNIRELQHMIEKLVVNSPSALIRASDIPLDHTVSSDYTASSNCTPFTQARRLTLHMFEKEYLLNLLNECSWNITKAAERAKRDRRWLQRLMRKHKLTPAVNM